MPSSSVSLILTISWLKSIQDYCNTDTIDKSSNISFIQKIIKIHNEEKLFPINYDDFGFRVNYKTEKILKPDFGIVKDLEPEDETTVALVGTWAYASPEKISGLPLDHRSDLYSFGIILGWRIIPEKTEHTH